MRLIVYICKMYLDLFPREVGVGGVVGVSICLGIIAWQDVTLSRSLVRPGHMHLRTPLAGQGPPLSRNHFVSHSARYCYKLQLRLLVNE